MKNIDEFINRITTEDVDLLNKLDNLCGAGQITEEEYDTICNDEEIFSNIEDYIIEILNGDIGDSELTQKYTDFIVSETEMLYKEGLITEPDDYTGGLYNCDDLYLYAIADALAE